jgi:uncharacterized protein (DUF58 family)
VGDSQEFLSLRDYRPGDPLRRIHWKSWAKTEKPIVKEYQDEFFVRHALILDTFMETEESNIFEEAVSVAASFAYSIPTQESLLDVMFVGTEAFCFTSGRGMAQAEHMLEILASVKLCNDKPFNVLTTLVMARSSYLSGCICIFLSWDEERERLVEYLEGIHVPLLALIVGDNRSLAHLDQGDIQKKHQSVRILQVGTLEEDLARI